jgi:hypothetical protein
MLPGLDGTGRFFRPLSFARFQATRRCSSPNPSPVWSRCECCKKRLRAEWFRGRFERVELERIDGPHFLLQAKPRERAQRISEFSARIGV